jgi:hypothetical protein
MGLMDNMINMVNELLGAKPGSKRKAREDAIAARIAKEFATQEGLDAYMKEHPKAKKENHSVKKAPEEGGGEEEDSAAAPGGESEEESGSSSSGGALDQPAPAAVKKADGALKKMKNKFKKAVGGALEKAGDKALSTANKMLPSKSYGRKPKMNAFMGGCAAVGMLAGAAGGAAFAAPIAGMLGISGATGVLAATVLGLKGAGIGATIGSFGGVFAGLGAAAATAGIGVALGTAGEKIQAALKTGSMSPELKEKLIDYIYSVNPEEVEAMRPFINADGTLNKELFVKELKAAIDQPQEKEASVKFANAVSRGRKSAMAQEVREAVIADRVTR